MKSLLALLLSPLARLAGLGQRVGRLWAFARLQAALPGGRLDPTTVVLGPAELHGSRRIRLGRGLFLYRDLHLETQGAGEIAIGDRVVISRGAHLVAFAGIRIGAGSMIGEYASLRDANHRTDAATPLRDAGHAARPIEVGREVWIGRGATILSGVRIGDRAVVGANAVVTADVPAGARVGGVPARPLPVRRSSIRPSAARPLPSHPAAGSDGARTRAAHPVPAPHQTSRNP
jgi:acetyltransferase-like isoleucine patch superfamily enzyme